jgi:hypothetical protein
LKKDKKQKRIMECGSVSTGAGGPPGIRQGGKKDFIKEEIGHIRLLSGFQKKLLGTGIK